MHAKPTEASQVYSKEIGLEVNTEKNTYMVMTRGQRAGKSHHRPE